MKQFNLNSKNLKLLSEFFNHPNQPLYVRQVAKNLSWPASTTSRLLSNLEKLELLRASLKGRLKLFQINPHHPLLPEIKSLVNKQYGYITQITLIINKISQINQAFIYGSATTQKLNSNSDIDLLIVGSPPIDQLNTKLNKLESQLNRPVNYTLYSDKEFKAEKIKPGFLSKILNSKTISLINNSIHESN
ncbi:MAG: nucleotidyltransferase domain-containing protein [Candidatus Beckwithbacteria bacterium]